MNVFQRPSADRLRELLNYDPTSGVFSWRLPRRGIRTGNRLGCDNGSGYLRITVDGVSHYAHRIAWAYVHGTWPPEEVDHINGARGDNRIVNLRLATRRENSLNRHGAQCNSTTGVIGVSWHKMAKKWQAHFGAKYLGLFRSIEDASVAYQQAKDGS